ncbi:MAG TPA: hypothetical protein VKD90_22950 [Gemmataceae bacterium]|nr:hypothetical protein [Gemmataceae bacterium]
MILLRIAGRFCRRIVLNHPGDVCVADRSPHCCSPGANDKVQQRGRLGLTIHALSLLVVLGLFACFRRDRFARGRRLRLFLTVQPIAVALAVLVQLSAPLWLSGLNP